METSRIRRSPFGVELFVSTAFRRRRQGLGASRPRERGTTNKDETVEGFRREMKAVGKLAHPNIVAAHDAGEFEGTHFLVMELIEALTYLAWCAASAPWRSRTHAS